VQFTDKLEYLLLTRKLFYIDCAHIGHSEFTADMKLASKSSGTSNMYPPAICFRVPKDKTDRTDLDFKKFEIKINPADPDSETVGRKAPVFQDRTT
jgi:hypothetical protein